MLLRLLVGLAWGVLLATSFDDRGTSLAMPVALAGWLILLRRIDSAAPSPGKPPRVLLQAGLVSLAFGCGFFFTLLFWLRAVALAAWPALSFVEALFLVPLGVLIVLIRRHLSAWPLWASAAWVCVEAIRSSWPFSGLPWGRLSYAVADTAWAPGLPWYGFTGVSALIFATACVLAVVVEHVLGRRWVALRAPVLLGAAAVGLMATVAPMLLAFPLTTVGTARVAVVQGDVPGAGNDLVSVHREVTQSHADLTVELGERLTSGAEAPIDLVIWPENATAVDPFTDAEARGAIERASAAVQVPLLVGGMVDAADPEHVLNQGIVWEPGVGGGDRYTKKHPVPFGEYIPWRDTLTGLLGGVVGRLDEVPRDMLSGNRETPLRAGDLMVADAICFDVGYDDSLQSQLRNGAQLAVVQTSNAMFIGTSQIAQQFEMTRLRAIESGRWLAVGAVNGLSAVVAPDGTATTVPERSREVLVHQVELIDTVTLSVRMGDWPGRMAGLITLLAIVLILSRSRVGSARTRRVEGMQQAQSDVMVGQ